MEAPTISTSTAKAIVIALGTTPDGEFQGYELRAMWKGGWGCQLGYGLTMADVQAQAAAKGYAIVRIDGLPTFDLGA